MPYALQSIFAHKTCRKKSKKEKKKEDIINLASSSKEDFQGIRPVASLFFVLC